MDQEPPPLPSTAFDLNELSRLNEELRQLRESIRRKRLEREEARRKGKSTTVDLRPELLRLDRFIEELDHLRMTLKSSALAKTDHEASDAEPLRNVLLQMRNQLVTEKEGLEGENALSEFREQLKREAEELRVLREQLAKDKETLEEERDSLESLLAQVKEEQERLRSIFMKVRQEISGDEPPRLKLPYEHRKAEQLEDRSLEFLIDQLSTIKTELREMREHFVREERALESKQRELERKALETTVAEARDDLAERTIRKIRNELESERIELASLRRSIQEIKAANARERGIIERDRNAILRAQIRLEREKERIAQKGALAQLRERRERIARGTLSEVGPREIRKRRRRRTGGRREIENGLVMQQLNQRRTIEGETIILGVKLGTGDYGIDTTQVREIIQMREITPIPSQPPYVEGVMNVRGAVIPVINLKKRFGLEEKGSDRPHIVVIESTKGLVGMLVDSVIEIIRVPAQDIHPPPPVTKGIDGEYLRGICRLGENLIIYLDLEKLLEQAVPIDRTAGL